MEITIKLPFFQSSITYLAFPTLDASPFRLAVNNIKENKLKSLSALAAN